jgi:hypothetical protein
MRHVDVHQLRLQYLLHDDAGPRPKLQLCEQWLSDLRLLHPQRGDIYRTFSACHAALKAIVAAQPHRGFVYRTQRDRSTAGAGTGSAKSLTFTFLLPILLPALSGDLGSLGWMLATIPGALPGVVPSPRETLVAPLLHSLHSL